MRDTTFTELCNQARHFFDLVEAGEIVRVLRNGKPIAEIRPVQQGGPSWKQRKALPLAVSGVDIGRLILADRGADARVFRFIGSRRRGGGLRGGHVRLGRPAPMRGRQGDWPDSCPDPDTG